MADDTPSFRGATSRRGFLTTTGAGVGAFALAGCLGGGNGGNGNGNGNGSGGEAPGASGDLVMTTSSSGTTAYAASQGISAAIEENGDGDVRVDARPSSGTDANVARLDRQESDISYIQNWTAARLREGEEPFDDLSYQPCQVFHLYNLPWIFATANADWTSITDIAGESRVVPTPRGSGTRPALEHGLDYATDTEYDRTSVQYGDLGSAFSEGRIDSAAITILNGDIEPGWVQEMKGSVDLRLLDWPEGAVEEMRNDDRLFISDVDMTNFDGYDYAPDTLPSITFAYNFVVRDDLDYDTLYAFLETLHEARENLSDYNALLGYHEDPEYWVTDMYDGMPFHPAAADFYEEIGVWRDEFERYEE
ncbi:MAG: TRAP transporter TAXI family solute receptor [Natronomonas sp.]|jgi:TRAP transporter TAXI family solute receptor